VHTPPVRTGIRFAVFTTIFPHGLCLLPVISSPSLESIRRFAQPGCSVRDEPKPAVPANTLASWPFQSSRAGCWMARANENASAQGSRDLNLTFIAFKRADANSAGWPPDRNAIAVRQRHGSQEAVHGDVGYLFQCRMTSAGRSGSTIFGFRTMPSSMTVAQTVRRTPCAGLRL